MIDEILLSLGGLLASWLFFRYASRYEPPVQGGGGAGAYAERTFLAVDPVVSNNTETVSTMAKVWFDDDGPHFEFDDPNWKMVREADGGYLVVYRKPPDPRVTINFVNPEDISDEDRVDELVSRWHDSGTEVQVSLQEWLGMTDAQYDLWAVHAILPDDYEVPER